jgi:hypothetical protein
VAIDVNPFDRAFEDRLRAKLAEMREHLVEDIVSGLEPPLYQRQCGAVATIAEVVAVMDEIRKALLNE